MKNQKVDFDVIIVGGGPAGANCARELSKMGHQVLLIERSQTIGEPNFSSAAMPDYVLEEFSLPQNVIGDFWDKFQIVTPSSSFTWKYQTKRGYVLKFNELKRFLVEDAIIAKCKVLVGTSVTAPLIENNKITGVKYSGIEKGWARAKIIVDASGPTGIIASKIGLRKTILSAPSFALEYLMVKVNFPQKNTLSFYLGRKFAPHGYAWIFPMGDSLAKVGLAIYESTSFTHKLLLDLLKEFVEKIDWLKDAQPLELHGGSLYITGGIKNYVHSNVVVIGDAAAQVNPLGAEGIRHVLRASRIAAKSIDLALKSRKVSKLSNYQKDWRSYIGKKWQLSSLLSQIVYPKFDDQTYDKALSLAKNLPPEDIFDIFFEYEFTKGFGVLKGEIPKLFPFEVLKKLYLS